MLKKGPEVLVPCGDAGCIRTAVAAGADAVYFGGELFNARRKAGNFSLEDIRSAVAYCHQYGVKTNITLNTLVKDSEWDMLEDYLDDLLEAGPDALIIQDLGVAALAAGKIAERYPDIQMHASTQMAVEDLQGALYLKELGFSRVVLARELSLDEIREITECSGLETEVFIHGALCYCDSGRCLLSSFHGGRSGNRGTCAQACRLLYDAEGQKGFYMNLKDRFTGEEELAALIGCGVSSLKIEGRMKGLPYVAASAAYYRHQIDALTGNTVNRREAEEKEELRQIFNRGDFTTGYYYAKNRMIERRSVKNQGIEIGRVVRAEKNSVRIHSEKELHSGDEIEIMTQRGSVPIRLQDSMLTRDHKDASFRLSGKIQEGQTVRRIVDPVLNEKLRENYASPRPIMADFSFKARKNLPIQLSVVLESGEKITVKGMPAQEAQKMPMTCEQIEKQLRKTGGNYEARAVQIDMDDDLFMPVSAVNSVRRDALDKLSLKKSRGLNRKSPEESEKLLTGQKHLAAMAAGICERPASSVGCRYHIELNSAEQWNALKNCDLSGVARIIFSMEDFAFLSKEEKRSIASEAEKTGAILCVRYPRAGRMTRQEWIEKQVLEWKNAGVRDFEATRLGQLYEIRERKDRVWLSPDLGCMNETAAKIWAEQAEGFCLSCELTLDEMTVPMKVPGAEMFLYGKIPYMVTEQCVYKERYTCRPDPAGHRMTLQDRQGEKMSVKSLCPICCSEIYSSKPVFPAQWEDMEKTGNFRISFTDENGECAAAVWNQIRAGLTPEISFAEGHFRKGVE